MVGQSRPAVVMGTPEDPTPGEVWRRVDDMRDELRTGFDSLNKRLDNVPTSDLIAAHLRTWESQLATVREDVDEIKADQKQQKRESRRAMQWAVSGVVIPLATALLALLGIVNGWGPAS